MKTVIDLIKSNSDRYPEFSEYIPNITEAVNLVNTRPDRSIENCKALFEGLSRSLILRLDKESDRKMFNRMPFEQQVTRAVVQLQRIETTTPSPISNLEPFVQMLQGIRNERGDVSHGRPAPKHDYSEQRLAEYILETTETYLKYMLLVFYDSPGIIRESTELQTIRYEDHPKFNDWLDEENGPRGEFLYSECLFHIFPNDYKTDLEEWQERQKEMSELVSSFIEKMSDENNKE